MAATLKNRKCLNSNRFNGTLIVALLNSKVTLFTPWSTPAILYDPELCAGCVINSISNQKDGMIGELEWVETACEAYRRTNIPSIISSWLHVARVIHSVHRVDCKIVALASGQNCSYSYQINSVTTPNWFNIIICTSVLKSYLKIVKCIQPIFNTTKMYTTLCS